MRMDDTLLQYRLDEHSVQIEHNKTDIASLCSETGKLTKCIALQSQQLNIIKWIAIMSGGTVIAQVVKSLF
jgi:hypothetical protein